MLPCMFKQMFGFDCIGCGIQRAILLVFHGEFGAAFKMFPAIYTTVLFAIALLLHLVDSKRSYHKWVIGLAITNALILIGSYAFKMTNLIN